MIWSLLPAAALVGYLFGSIPFGIVLTRLAGTQDLRTIGSGNIGATNVLRTGRKDLAAATLILDALKGTAAALLGAMISPEAALAAAGGAFLGHLFPVWLGFLGGKGVATYLGVLIGLAWPAAFAFALLWMAVAALSRYSSLSALTASALTPLVLVLLGRPGAAWLMAGLTVLLWAKHWPNIQRLRSGTEGRIGARA